MNDMPFEGIITRADLHTEAGRSFIQLRLTIDVTEEIMIEEYGIKEDLEKKFGLSAGSPGDVHETLAGKHCRILRNAQGYHFVSFL